MWATFVRSWARVFGVSEVVDHKKDGLICEPSVDSIYATISDYIKKQEDYNRLGESGYKKLNDSFSMDRMIDNLENYFDIFID